MSRNNKKAAAEYKDKYAAYRSVNNEKDKPENLTKSAKKLIGLLKGKEIAVIITDI